MVLAEIDSESIVREEGRRFARMLLESPAVFSAFWLALKEAMSTNNPADAMQRWLRLRGYGTTLEGAIDAVEELRRDDTFAWRGGYEFARGSALPHRLVVVDTNHVTLNGAPLDFEFKNQTLTWKASGDQLTSGSLTFSLDAPNVAQADTPGTATIAVRGTIDADAVSSTPLVLAVSSGPQPAPSMKNFLGTYTTTVVDGSGKSAAGAKLVVQADAATPPNLTFYYADGRVIANPALSTDAAGNPTLTWNDASSTQTAGSITFRTSSSGASFTGKVAALPAALPDDANFQGTLVTGSAVAMAAYAGTYTTKIYSVSTTQPGTSTPGDNFLVVLDSTAPTGVKFYYQKGLLIDGATLGNDASGNPNLLWNDVSSTKTSGNVTFARGPAGLGFKGRVAAVPAALPGDINFTGDLVPQQSSSDGISWAETIVGGVIGAAIGFGWTIIALIAKKIVAACKKQKSSDITRELRDLRPEFAKTVKRETELLEYFGEKTGTFAENQVKLKKIEEVLERQIDKAERKATEAQEAAEQAKQALDAIENERKTNEDLLKKAQQQRDSATTEYERLLKEKTAADGLVEKKQEEIKKTDLELSQLQTELEKLKNTSPKDTNAIEACEKKIDAAKKRRETHAIDLQTLEKQQSQTNQDFWSANDRLNQSRNEVTDYENKKSDFESKRKSRADEHSKLEERRKEREKEVKRRKEQLDALRKI